MQVTMSAAACITVRSVQSFLVRRDRALFAQIICCFEPPLEFCVQILDSTELDLVVKTLGGGLFGLEDTGALDRAVGLDREDDVGLADRNAGERRLAVQVDRRLLRILFDRSEGLGQRYQPIVDRPDLIRLTNKVLAYARHV